MVTRRGGEVRGSASIVALEVHLCHPVLLFLLLHFQYNIKEDPYNFFFFFSPLYTVHCWASSETNHDSASCIQALRDKQVICIPASDDKNRMFMCTQSRVW